jgi:hypothetical protein
MVAGKEQRAPDCRQTSISTHHNRREGASASDPKVSSGPIPAQHCPQEEDRGVNAACGVFEHFASEDESKAVVGKMEKGVLETCGKSKKKSDLAVPVHGEAKTGGSGESYSLS